jgi:hypothetical protein
LALTEGGGLFSKIPLLRERGIIFKKTPLVK